MLKPPLACFALVSVVCFALAGCGVGPPVGIGLTQSSFDFGQTVVAQKATRTITNLTNNGTGTATVTLKISGDPSLSLASDLSCGASLAPGGSCAIAVNFLPTQPKAVTGTLSLTLQNVGGIVSQTVSLTGSGTQISGGGSLVQSTVNPVVARYIYQPESSGTVAVRFGPDTNYGLTTSTVPTPSDGGPVSILVAGMRQNTTYHMQAVLAGADGSQTLDADHTFTTTSFPSAILPTINATTASGQTPQPGIQLNDAALSTSIPGWLEAYATDLSGTIIWGYNFTDRPTANTIVQPIQLLPNGDMLLTISFANQYLAAGQGVTLTPADESVDLVREIDLAGDPVRQLTLSDLNAKLAAAGYSEVVSDIHHDVAVLPNGHMILITAMLKNFTDLTGYPGTTGVLGDVLVDLDPNFNVTWVWNEFDHLDVNRHPMNFPDWTHTNAVVYSPADGNLLVSMRHQDWIVKVDYANGAGAGDILWRLGNGGDFTLQGGTSPTDWFYAQHEPSFVGTPTAGQFSLAMMDNGDNRILASGATCGDTANPCYTTVPIIAVDEQAKTASITFRQTLPNAQYSEWGGDAKVLANGDLTYDLCAEPNGTGSEVDEITTGTSSKPVWTLKETGANLYRSHRLPSLYYGVQW